MDDDTKKNDTPESESTKAEDMGKNGGAEDRAPDSMSDGDAEEALEEFEKSLENESGAEPVRRNIGATPARLPSTINTMIRGFFSDFFKIRNEPTIWGRAVMAGMCLAIFLAIWFLTTRGQAEFRIISPVVIGSPAEVFGQFRNLWFGQESDLVFAEMVSRLQLVQHYIFPRDGLMEHFMASMSRVIKGFLLAALVAIPLGILCGTFKRIDAFLAPVQIFGRNNTHCDTGALDLDVVRSWRRPESGVYFHFVCGIYSFRRLPEHFQCRQVLPGYGIHPRRQPFTGTYQGAGAAGDARYFQFPAAAFRPGFRLYHPGRNDRRTTRHRQAYPGRSKTRPPGKRLSYPAHHNLDGLPDRPGPDNRAKTIIPVPIPGAISSV